MRTKHTGRWFVQLVLDVVMVVAVLVCVANWTWGSETEQSVDTTDIKVMMELSNRLMTVIEKHPDATVRASLIVWLDSGELVVDYVPNFNGTGDGMFAVFTTERTDEGYRSFLTVNMTELRSGTHLPQYFLELAHACVHYRQVRDGRVRPQLFEDGSAGEPITQEIAREAFEAECEAWAAECRVSQRLTATDVPAFCARDTVQGASVVRQAVAAHFMSVPLFAPFATYLQDLALHPPVDHTGF